ncbi:hypothetical protein D3C84_817010 [compost metagenome]
MELPDTHLDWETQEVLDNKFSSMTIPLYNYGGTTAINIKYSYKLTNFDKVKEYIDDDSNSIFPDYALELEQIDDKEYQNFNLVIKNPSKKLFRIPNHASYINLQDSIQSNGKIDIFLPSYFLIIINHSFRVYSLDEAIVLPELELKIKYNDINNKVWIVKYTIKMDSAYRYRNNHLNSNFIYEFISKKYLN